MRSPSLPLRRHLRIWAAAALALAGIALAGRPVAAQTALPNTPQALANRYAGAWQGTWISPDGHAWQGRWAGDLLTPDGRAVGPEEFARFEGTAFLVIHPPAARDGVDWSREWLGNCQDALNYNGLADTDVCGAWLRYYRHSGWIDPGYAYAVPVNLALLPGAGCHCRTVTSQSVTEYIKPRHHKTRVETRSKLIRMGN